MERETAEIVARKGYVQTSLIGANGEYTPINTKALPTAKDSTILFHEDVVRKMMEIAQRTHDQDSEYGFVLVGKVWGENKVEIVAIYENNPEEQVERRNITYSPKTISFIDKFTRENNRDDVAVFICHTHPDRGNYYANFSLGDIDGMVKDYKKNLHFRGKDIAYGMLTGDGQFSVAFYDPNRKDFYRFEKVLVYDEKAPEGKKLVTFDAYVKSHSNLRGIPSGDGR